MWPLKCPLLLQHSPHKRKMEEGREEGNDGGMQYNYDGWGHCKGRQPWKEVEFLVGCGHVIFHNSELPGIWRVLKRHLLARIVSY